MPDKAQIEEITYQTLLKKFPQYFKEPTDWDEEQFGISEFEGRCLITTNIPQNVIKYIKKLIQRSIELNYILLFDQTPDILNIRCLDHYITTLDLFSEKIIGGYRYKDGYTEVSLYGSTGSKKIYDLEKKCSYYISDARFYSWENLKLSIETFFFEDGKCVAWEDTGGGGPVDPPNWPEKLTIKALNASMDRYF